jgi:hypothetical protein
MIFVNNALPIADAGGDMLGDEGELITFDGTNSYDTPSDIDSLFHTWYFGDGAVGFGKISSHIYQEDGVYTVILKINDDNKAIAYDTITVTINNVAPKIQPVPHQLIKINQAYALQIIASDVQEDSLSFSDNSTMFDIDSKTGMITFSPAHEDVGTHIIKIRVADDDGEESFIDLYLTIHDANNAPLITSTPTIQAVEDVPYIYVLEAEDGDKLSYSIDKAPVGMSINQLTGIIHWVPINDQVGDNEVIVNVSDSQKAYALQTFTIKVENNNDAPVLEPIEFLTARVGGIFSYTVLAVDIDEGDTLEFSDDTDLFDIDSTTGQIVFTPSNDDVGTFVIKITVTDSKGESDYRKIIFVVNNKNNPPTLVPISTQKLVEDESYTLVVETTYSDQEANLTFSDDTELFEINPKTGEISFIPNGKDAGAHYVTITVTNGNGEFDQMTVLFTLAKDKGEFMGFQSIITLIIISSIGLLMGYFIAVRRR